MSAKFLTLFLGLSLILPSAHAYRDVSLVDALLHERDLKKIAARIKSATTAELNTVDKSHARTPLLAAINRGNIDLVLLLIEQGADINQGNPRGLPLLHWAIERKLDPISRLLISKGAEIGNKNFKGKTPIEMAVTLNLLETVEELLPRLKKSAPLTVLSKELAPEFAVPLMHLATSGEMISKLLEHGVDINQKVKDGSTALLAAILRNDAPLAEVLIERGADVNEVNLTGKSPLHVVLDKHVARILLEKGADIQKLDGEGNTPLLSILKIYSLASEKATSRSKTRLSRLAIFLMNSGVNVHLKNKAQESAADYAIKLNLDSLQSALEGAGVNMRAAIEEDMVQFIKRSINHGTLSIHCSDSRHGPWTINTSLLQRWIEQGIFDKLVSLSIQGCNIEQLPESMHSLAVMTDLLVTNSNLASLENLYQIPNLSWVDVSKNAITELPESLKLLRRLRVLNLDENKIRDIPSSLVKQFREQMVDLKLKGNPLDTAAAAYSTTPKTVADMARYLDSLDRQDTSSREDLACLLGDPRADLGAFINTPGAKVEKILKDLLTKNTSAFMEGQQNKEQSYRPATKLLATKLIQTHRLRQELKFLQSRNTSIGRSLDEQSLPQRSKENIHKLDDLLGPMSGAEHLLYEKILGMPLFLKHYTEASRYQKLVRTDSELKSFKTLSLDHPDTMYRDSTPNTDCSLGNNGNVFFRLETSSELDATSRFGKSVIVMNENMLYKNGWIYLWDLVMSAGEAYPTIQHAGHVVRIAFGSVPVDKELNVLSVKGHKITIKYPTHPDGEKIFEFSITDTFFYGKEIKQGLAKFMVYEVRNMGMTQDLIADPDELKLLYRKLYKIQAMLPGAVKLNPINHKFLEPN